VEEETGGHGIVMKDFKQAASNRQKQKQQQLTDNNGVRVMLNVST